MAIEHGIWRIAEDDQVKPVELIKRSMDYENKLEALIVQDVSILNKDWLLIGQQVHVDGGFIDLLALDVSGKLIVIELKRGQTPRDVVAQILDYASSARYFDFDKLDEIYKAFSQSRPHLAQTLDEAIKAKFGNGLEEVNFNAEQQLVVVAASLDASTERIVSYLSAVSGIDINVLFFNVFSDGGVNYLSRVWMLDAVEIERNKLAANTLNPWNGECYVSFGECVDRNWDDARKYGFISAGGGAWYSNTLLNLNKGDRVWVNAPGSGYVGVGIVRGPRQTVEEFRVNGKSLLELPTKTDYSALLNQSVDQAEYLVAIEWLHTVAVENAVREVGFFGNQNTVCKPLAKKWEFTVERLKQRWHIGV